MPPPTLFSHPSHTLPPPPPLLLPLLPLTPHTRHYKAGATGSAILKPSHPSGLVRQQQQNTDVFEKVRHGVCVCVNAVNAVNACMSPLHFCVRACVRVCVCVCNLHPYTNPLPPSQTVASACHPSPTRASACCPAHWRGEREPRRQQ